MGDLHVVYYIHLSSLGDFFFVGGEGTSGNITSISY